MGLAKIHMISCILLALGSVTLSECAKRNLDEDTRDKLDEVVKIDFLSFTKDDYVRTTTEINDDSDDKQSPGEELPLLPPIILLDFNNDTNDANSSNEEKSKRTVNGGLGYGFERNSFLSKKSNYYLPMGKTGTTVSIEESISPFLPRTIIEKYTANNQSPNERVRADTQSDTTYRFFNPRFSTESQSAFGHRTKFDKATSYYNAFDSNYRGSDQPSHRPSISTSTPSSNRGQQENYFDSKFSSRYTFTNVNGPSSYQASNFNTDLHGQRGNIFRPTGQTYVERGQNVFRPTIPTPRTDNSQILRENQSALRSSTPDYYGPKQASFDTLPTDPLNSSPRSHSGNQATIYTKVHPQSYNEQSKTVLTTSSPLDPNLPSYGHSQNIYGSNVNEQVYEGQRQNLRLVQQDPLISDIRNYGRNQNDYRNYGDQRQTDPKVTTPNSLETNYELIRNPTNLPRYGVENGVRYENKVFWKYPDGRISYDPPQAYVESYTEDSTVRPQITNIRESYQEIDPSTENNGDPQGPLQFPIISETSSQRSPFVSSESLASNLSHQQAYRIGYQNLVSQNPVSVLAQRAKIDSTASTASTYLSTTPFPTTKKPRLSHAKPNRHQTYFSSIRTTTERPVSRYMVGGPNAEYIDSTEPTLTNESGELHAHILARYTPRVRNYLKTIFTADGGARNKGKQYYKNSKNYENLRYSDLVNYNPSISRYIKDPSSILNVEPTFVQVGNSLVPVIILKVDGTAPVQPEATSNINLKALLQEYLVQYANSIKELARPTDYQLGTEQFSQTQRTIETGNRLLQLVRQNEASSSFPPSNAYSPRQDYKEDDFLLESENRPTGKFGDRTVARQKIKSVQIIDDPRFPSYNYKS